MKLFLALLLATTTTFAMGGKGKGHKRAEEFKKELNLTDEQVKKFEALKEKRGETHELRKKFKEAKKDFRGAVKDSKVSADELRTKFDSYMKLREELHRKRFDNMMEKRAILTPEQFEKFLKLRKKWEGKKGKGKGKGKKAKC